MFIGRVQFFHFFYTAMPFVCMAVAVHLSDLWRQGRGGRVLVAAYLGLVAAMFFYWYPLLTGWPVSHAFFKQHMWFRSWI